MDFSPWKTIRNMNMLDRYMVFIALFGKTFLILQISKIVREGSSDNVSFAAYLLYFITSFSWLIFGIYYKETIVATSSLFGIIGGLSAMSVIMLYKTDKLDLL